MHDLYDWTNKNSFLKGLLKIKLELNEINSYAGIKVGKLDGICRYCLFLISYFAVYRFGMFLNCLTLH